VILVRGDVAVRQSNQTKFLVASDEVITEIFPFSCGVYFCSQQPLATICRKHKFMKSEQQYRGADKSLARPGRKQNLQRQNILILIYPIYNHNWRNVSSIYIYNKTSIKRNILTIRQNTSGSRSG